MSPTISTEDLRLRYRNTTALDGVTLSLDGPGIYGLIGRNGSGKTSLMSVLAGFRRATGGAVRVNDQPVFENPRVTPQICLIRGGGDTVEYDFRSRVKDALRLAADLRPNWDADYAGELVRQFGISQRKRVGHLSTGQRSALASVLGWPPGPRSPSSTRPTSAWTRPPATPSTTRCSGTSWRTRGCWSSPRTWSTS